MDRIDGYQLPDFASEGTTVDRLDLMADTVQLADQTGVLAPLPTNRTEAYEEELSPSRVATIRTRLHLLGYLKKDNGSPRLGENIRRAIARFQTEAALEVDRWVGVQTWTALQQLVDFESSADMTRWVGRAVVRGALWRAVRLRLHILGFLGSRTVRSEAKVTRALERFSDVAWALHLSNARLPARLCLETLTVLFDQDGIAGRLAKAGSGFAFRQPEGMSESEIKSLGRRFIISAASIELWLLGYDVPLKGAGTYSLPRKFPYSPKAHRMFYALERFWRARGQNQKLARTTAKRVDGAFFRELAAVEREAEQGGPELDSEVVFQQIADLGKRSQRSVWGHIKAIGSRLWDGVKRIWRWIKSLLRRAGDIVQYVVEWTKNLARLAYSYAKTSFAAVVRAVGRFAGSISFLLHKRVPGSDPAHLLIRRDADLDYTLFAPNGRDPTRARSIAANLAYQARIFAAGIRILAALVGVVIRTAAKLTWAGGWFIFILSLARVFREFKQLTGALADDIQILTAPGQ